MEFFKRITAVPEKFYLEISIHSVCINLPLASSIQVIVKRNKTKKEKTRVIPINENKGFIDATINFPVTLYKSSNNYNSKVYSFRLLQICNNKTIKNGKAKLDLNKIVNFPLILTNLQLNNCSDAKAYLCISASLQKIAKTMSCSQPSIIESPPERNSASVDETIFKSPEQKKIQAKNKFLRRLEKVNDFHNSPQSTRIIQESDDSSCASPLSPDRSPDSPNKIENFEGKSLFFIKPILIEYDSERKSHENIENVKNIANIENIPEITIEEAKEQSEHSVSSDSELASDSAKILEKPVSTMTEVQPNCNTKENSITNAEISSGSSENNKCCKCIII